MSVRIELDHRGSVFTCLDYVTGRVIMNIATEETISTITVKMEGIARTRLRPPGNLNERDSKRAEVEIHKLLYLVETVFPSAEIRGHTSANSSGYTLKPGQYEYPFRIRIPINAYCTGGQGAGANLLQRLSFDKGSVDYVNDAQRHLPGTLPPSLSGIPNDEAWVRYFLKVTVNRPKFYKFNIRSYDPFVFLPIEPPRPSPTPNETYAKRQHQFVYSPLPDQRKRGGLFEVFRQMPAIDTQPRVVRFSIEARLPAPPIIVPNLSLPLRIILVKLLPYSTPVFIRSLQIHLYAFTEITAHDLKKTDRRVIPCLSLWNLRSPVGVNSSLAVGQEIEADASLWGNASLPDTVPPSFRTCNIWRTYQLEIILGLSHGDVAPAELIQLNMPIQVYSGICPPQKLLDSARQPVPPLPPRTKAASSLKVPTVAFGGGMGGYNSATNSPVSSPISPAIPARPHSSAGGTWHPIPSGRPGSVSSISPEDEVPPPTYEDAIAEDIGPVDGPRRRYEQEGGYYGALPEDVS